MNNLQWLIFFVLEMFLIRKLLLFWYNFLFHDKKFLQKVLDDIPTEYTSYSSYIFLFWEKVPSCFDNSRKYFMTACFCIVTSLRLKSFPNIFSRKNFNLMLVMAVRFYLLEESRSNMSISGCKVTFSTYLRVSLSKRPYLAILYCHIIYKFRHVKVSVWCHKINRKQWS